MQVPYSNGAEKLKLVCMFSTAGVTGVPIFSSEGQRLGLGLGLLGLRWVKG